MFRERSDFELRGINEDVVDLRFNHSKNRLMDTLNRIISLRRDIKDDERKKD